MRRANESAITVLTAALWLLLGTGCAGMARGVAEAMLTAREEAPDSRRCLVRGRSFEGMEAMLARQVARDQPPDRVLRVLMVHGIGSHQPGYATTLAENLARALSLPSFRERVKQFELWQPDRGSDTLGTLRVSEYFSEQPRRVMAFYELTWDPIVEDEKQRILFDSSGELGLPRAVINDGLKLFVNDTVPDLLMYNGLFRDDIRMSIAQSLCWMMSRTWDGLPDRDKAYCESEGPDRLARIGDDYAFITHSLGSQITLDALSAITRAAKSDEGLSEAVAALRDKTFSVFMLSNQLPLLQLGQPPPEVVRRVPEICRPDSMQAHERLLGETRLVAFSDPNDLFSYAIPHRFLDEQVDSRLCPSLTNVILNVAPVNDVLGMGEFANPMKAHTGYHEDDRVIALLTRGIGHSGQDPMVRDRCEYFEAVASW
jgi:hypothetical protein